MRPLINLLKRVGPLRNYVQGRRRERRLNERLDEIRTVIKLGFKAHLDEDAVARDYAFSLKTTDRQCCQVLLIEDAMHMLSQRGLGGALVECGVFTGGASAFMLRSALRYFQHDAPPYWGFDSFEGMPHTTEQDGEQSLSWLVEADGNLTREVAKDGSLVGTEVNKADFETVQAYLRESGYPADKLNLVKGWFQHTLTEAAGQIGPIAILRLDGDFYESTRTCLETLGNQVVPGGIVIFDDYGSFEGCRRAVDEWIGKQTSFSLPIYYDNHQAFVVRVRAESR